MLLRKRLIIIKYYLGETHYILFKIDYGKNKNKQNFFIRLVKKKK